MEEYRLYRDGKPDLHFTGECIAAADSSLESGSPRFIATGIRHELRLYRTAGGAYVCHHHVLNQWQGARNSNRAAVVSTEAGVIEFFGHDWLAKELYDEAGIHVEAVLGTPRR